MYTAPFLALLLLAAFGFVAGLLVIGGGVFLLLRAAFNRLDKKLEPPVVTINSEFGTSGPPVRYGAADFHIQPQKPWPRSAALDPSHEIRPALAEQARAVIMPIDTEGDSHD